MLDIVLRAYGEQFDVDSFVNQYPDLAIADAFKQGEPDMLGHPCAFSGFDVIVAENETAESCLQNMQQFVEKYQQAFSDLKANKVHCVFDIDATVVAGEAMPPSLLLPPDLLGVLHKLNIAIEFTAYPHIEAD
jgi:hypothetical protein